MARIRFNNYTLAVFAIASIGSAVVSVSQRFEPALWLSAALAAVAVVNVVRIIMKRDAELKRSAQT
jgi:hypothetical protein